MHYVYILKSLKDNSKYIGYTHDLKARLNQHNNKGSKYSSTKAPFMLAWYCAFKEKELALEFERYLKSSSGYAFTSKHLL